MNFEDERRLKQDSFLKKPQPVVDDFHRLTASLSASDSDKDAADMNYATLAQQLEPKWLWTKL